MATLTRKNSRLNPSATEFRPGALVETKLDPQAKIFTPRLKTTTHEHCLTNWSTGLDPEAPIFQPCGAREPFKGVSKKNGVSMILFGELEFEWSSNIKLRARNRQSRCHEGDSGVQSDKKQVQDQDAPKIIFFGGLGFPFKPEPASVQGGVHPLVPSIAHPKTSLDFSTSSCQDDDCSKIPGIAKAEDIEVAKEFPCSEQVENDHQLSKDEEDEYSFHHINFLGRPVYNQSTTPPATSLAAIMATPKAEHHTDEFSLRRYVILQEAFTWVDPILYDGPADVLAREKGSKLQKAVTGSCVKYYAQVGKWQDDAYDQDDDIPWTDPGDATQYHPEVCILNGWHENHNLPRWNDVTELREMEYTKKFEENQCAIKRRRQACANKSRLSQVWNSASPDTKAKNLDQSSTKSSPEHLSEFARQLAALGPLRVSENWADDVDEDDFLDENGHPSDSAEDSSDSGEDDDFLYDTVSLQTESSRATSPSIGTFAEPEDHTQEKVNGFEDSRDNTPASVTDDDEPAHLGSGRDEQISTTHNSFQALRRAPDEETSTSPCPSRSNLENPSETSNFEQQPQQSLRCSSEEDPGDDEEETRAPKSRHMAASPSRIHSQNNRPSRFDDRPIPFCLTGKKEAVKWPLQKCQSFASSIPKTG